MMHQRQRPRTEVPQELKDEIIGYLSTDREALKACSLSHSSFLTVCQKWLFVMVVLRGGYNRSNGQNFKTLLQDSPHLANYTKSIKLVEIPSLEMGNGLWLQSDTTLLATLPLLRNLTSFNLRCCWGLFSKISTDLVNCLSGVLRIPSLEHVELSAAPLQLLENAGLSLKHISLSRICPPEFHPCTSSLQNPPNVQLLIESLQLLDPLHRDMEHISNWLERTNNNLSFKGLKRLHISRGDKPSSHLAKIWDACQSSLEKLAYTPCDKTYALDPQETGVDYLDFSTLASLQTLCLRFDVGMDTWQGRFLDPFPWLIEHLGSLPPSNTVEELTIQLKIQENLDPGILQAWQGVGAVISKHLKCLHSIEIHVYCVLKKSCAIYMEEILQNTKDLQSTGFFRLIRVDRHYENHIAFPPFST